MGRLATWPSRIFTLIASMNSTAYTGSSGRFCHSDMPSITRSVIALIVCFETSAPYTSARCAQISPWVSPFADREITISRHGDLHRPGIGDHGLGAVTITGIAAITAGRVVLAVAEVVIEFALQCALYHHFRQLAQQAALAGQLQPARTGPLGELAQQLLIGRRQPRRLLALACPHIRHWCLLVCQELHR